MSTYNEMMYCAQCDKHTLHLRSKTNHILHFLITLVTFGLWSVIWLIVAIGNSLDSQCTVCGRTLNWTRDSPPRKAMPRPVAPHPDGPSEPHRTVRPREERMRDGTSWP